MKRSNIFQKKQLERTQKVKAVNEEHQGSGKWTREMNDVCNTNIPFILHWTYTINSSQIWWEQHVWEEAIQLRRNTRKESMTTEITNGEEKVDDGEWWYNCCCCYYYFFCYCNCNDNSADNSCTLCDAREPVEDSPSYTTTIENKRMRHCCTLSSLLNKGGRIGMYLPEARRPRIARFHAKCKMRIWRKRIIEYDCNKKAADSR